MENLLLKAVFATFLIVAGYYSYYYLSKSQKITSGFSGRNSFEQAEVYRFLYQKLAGFLFLGVIPVLLFFPVFDLKTDGFSIILSPDRKYSGLLYILHASVLTMAFFSARASAVYSAVPLMRLSNWKIFHLLISLAGWGIYLLAYEYIFRQILLFSWAEAFGTYTAILVNVILYALFHLHKGKLETLGSIPFGIVLCVVSLHAGSFLPALLLHFTLAASTEIFSIYHNPGMNFTFKLMKDG